MRTSLRSLCPALAAVLVSVLVSVLLPPGAARADLVDPTTAGPVRTLTYNVCGAYDDPLRGCQSKLDLATWAGSMAAQITSWDADAVMLQEACSGQLDELRSRLGTSYVAVWTATKPVESRCGKWGGGTQFGLGMLVRAPSVDTFEASLTLPAGSENLEPRALQCARARIDGRTTLVCNTHLAQYLEPNYGTDEVVAYIDTWALGLPVILGGDFNSDAGYTQLDPMRAGSPATGPFAEVDENDRDHFTQECLDAGAEACRSGEPTTYPNGTPRKFDHIFLTAADYHTVRGDAVEPGLSDHKLLRGAAYPQARPPSGVTGDLTGDGRVDLLAVQNEGNLRLYPGLGNGAFGSYRQIGTGGWTNALIAHGGGDWTGDGREDVVVRIGDQLWVYPNTGSGNLGTRIAMRGHPTGWTGATTITSPGDMDGDGCTDLVVRTSTGLWLHPGDPANRPGLRTTAPIQLGGTGWATLDPLAPGDVNHDGWVDLWARDRGTGQLWMYPNSGGTLGTRQAVGGGSWPAAERPLMASFGDATGDGYPDLWSTTNAGVDSALQLHPGTAPNMFGTAATVGTGGWQWILRLG